MLDYTMYLLFLVKKTLFNLIRHLVLSLVAHPGADEPGPLGLVALLVEVSVPGLATMDPGLEPDAHLVGVGPPMSWHHVTVAPVEAVFICGRVQHAIGPHNSLKVLEIYYSVT